MLISFYIILFIATATLTYIIRRIALQKSILDIPNQRSLHDKPVPRGGGLAFVLMFYVALIFLYQFHGINLSMLVAMLGGIPIAIIGYLDDLYSVKSYWRALVHFICAIWALYWLGGVPYLELGTTHFSHPYVSYLLAVFMIVWFVNFYNFMDGSDGLAGMEAVFVAVVAGVVLMNVGSSIATVCFALAATVLGFLVWNWPSAKIFMGDIGSGFLGFAFAILMCASNNQTSISIPFWWILIAMFLLDATFTLFNRIRKKEKWYEAHCEHAYQRLVQGGYSHRQVMLGMLVVNVVICLPLAWFFIGISSAVASLIYLFISLICFFLAWLLVVKKYPVTG